MAPFFTGLTRGIGGGGFSKRVISRFPLTRYLIYYAPASNIDLSPYGTVMDVTELKITAGGGGASGTPANPEGGGSGGPGGSTGIISYKKTTSAPLSLSVSAINNYPTIVSGPQPFSSSLSVPAIYTPQFSNISFSSGPGGAPATPNTNGWGGGVGGGGGGGIIISSSSPIIEIGLPIPNATGTNGSAGGLACGGGSGCRQGPGGSGGTGYGAGGGGGGGGSESDGNTSGGGAGGGGAIGIVIVKIEAYA